MTLLQVMTSSEPSKGYTLTWGPEEDDSLHNFAFMFGSSKPLCLPSFLTKLFLQLWGILFTNSVFHLNMTNEVTIYDRSGFM